MICQTNRSGPGRMSDSDDEANLPSAAECERRCQEFATITCTDSALAMFYLQDQEWIVEVFKLVSYSVIIIVISLNFDVGFPRRFFPVRFFFQ